MGMDGQRHVPAALSTRKGPDIHCTGGWVGPRAVWTGAENLTTAGVRSPDRLALSELLYRLSYPGVPCIRVCVCVFMYVCMYV